MIYPPRVNRVIVDDNYATFKYIVPGDFTPDGIVPLLAEIIPSSELLTSIRLMITD